MIGERGAVDDLPTTDFDRERLDLQHGPSIVAGKPPVRNAGRPTMGRWSWLQGTGHGKLIRRRGPLAVGGALVGGATFLVRHDPAAPGSLFPRCLLHQTTGLWCPGCGLTRGTYQLLHGDLIVGAELQRVHTAGARGDRRRMGRVVEGLVGGTAAAMPPQAGRWLSIAMPVLLIAYGVLRNLPVAPARALAP